MRIKKKTGHVVYTPLSYIFQVLEMGGSALQKYDATTSSFIPNRALTPLVLQPSLVISDPDGVIPTADYTRQMNSVSWTLTLIQNGSSTILPATDGTGTNYSVDGTSHKLTLFRNVQPQEVVHVEFSGKYTDARRGEVQDFHWERDLSCEAQTDMNVTLDAGRWKGNVLLVPMKRWGQFGIRVQLMNGKDPIPDTRCTYQWQWWTGSEWSEDFSEQPCSVSGEQTKEIIVDQDFVQKVVLRVKATAFGNNNTTRYWTTRMRRWFGQFDYDVDFLRGKYVRHDTDTVVLNAWVATAKGQIGNPCRYFDMELFFAVGNGDFKSVGYGEEAVVTRQDLQEGQPRCGILCRELSAYLALATNDGEVLCTDDGEILFAQFPTKSREV